MLIKVFDNWINSDAIVKLEHTYYGGYHTSIWGVDTANPICVVRDKTKSQVAEEINKQIAGDNHDR